MYKSAKFSARPHSGNVINQILYLEIPENNSRHVDKCCTAGLGTSKIWSLCCCTSVLIIEEHFDGLVIDLINMLIRLTKKMLDMGELASGSFWILMTYTFHFNHKILQDSPYPG